MLSLMSYGRYGVVELIVIERKWIVLGEGAVCSNASSGVGVVCKRMSYREA